MFVRRTCVYGYKGQADEHHQKREIMFGLFSKEMRVPFNLCISMRGRSSNHHVENEAADFVNVTSAHFHLLPLSPLAHGDIPLLLMGISRRANSNRGALGGSWRLTGTLARHAKPSLSQATARRHLNALRDCTQVGRFSSRVRRWLGKKGQYLGALSAFGDSSRSALQKRRYNTLKPRLSIAWWRGAWQTWKQSLSRVSSRVMILSNTIQWKAGLGRLHTLESGEDWGLHRHNFSY